MQKKGTAALQIPAKRLFFYTVKTRKPYEIKAFQSKKKNADILSILAFLFGCGRRI